MAGSLSAHGRGAVVGSEEVFSQEAFNAYATSQARFIGSVTRDHPHGSISAADRAKLAWNRSPAESRATFADDFLSLWLASGPGRASDGAPWEPATPMRPAASIA